MRRLKASSSRKGDAMDSPESQKFCLMCFKAVDSSIFDFKEKTEKWFNSTYNYLHSGITKKYDNGVEIGNVTKPLYCKTCFQAALQLTKLAEEFKNLQDENSKISLEKEIANLTASFSLAVLCRRDIFHNNITNNHNLITNHSDVSSSNIYFLRTSAIGKSTDENEHSVYCDVSSETDNTDVEEEDEDCTLGNSLASAVEEVENVDLRMSDLEMISQQGDSQPQEEEQVVNQVSSDPPSNYAVKMNLEDLMKTISLPMVVLERLQFPIKTEQSTTANTTMDPNRLEGVLRQSEENKRHKKQVNTSEELNISREQLRSSATKKKLLSAVGVKTRLRTPRVLPQKENKTRKKAVSFQCKQCSKLLLSRLKLKLHYKKSHPRNKEELKCSICQKEFHYPKVMKKHMATHADARKRKIDEETHKCAFCEKVFNRVKNFEKHIRVHTGEKPFKCKLCSKTFRDQSAKKQHERVHAGERPYKCAFCEKRFIDSSTKERHERIHTGTKCPFCPLRFKRSFEKEKHILEVHKQRENKTGQSKELQ